MDKIIFDKSKLDSSSSDCYDLTQKVLTDIDYVYELIANFSNDNVWAGSDADTYMSIRSKDRINYEKYLEQLKEYFLYLNKIGDEISSSSSVISVDGELVSKIDCQLSGIDNIVNGDLNDAINDLSVAYDFANSMSSPYQFSASSQLIECRNKINEVINSCNDISSWLKSSSNMVNSIFDTVDTDISKTEIDSIEVITPIVKGA